MDGKMEIDENKKKANSGHSGWVKRNKKLNKK